MKWFLLIIPFLLAAYSEQDEPPFLYRIDATRTHGGNWDTILVVATVQNAGFEQFRGWGALDFSGQYEPSAETAKRYSAVRDSAYVATAGKPELRTRDFHPRLPVQAIIGKANYEGLKQITLNPGDSYSDSLRFSIYIGDFEKWPGYINVHCDLLLGSGPADVVNARKISKPALKIAFPVP